MNYELAKKLKDNGFPMKFIRISNVPQDNSVLFIDGQNTYEFPTLSELIEACGNDSDGNKSINHPFSDVSQMSDFKTWEAKCWFTDKLGKGSTPEEAVANLWLELNKN